MAGSVGVLVRVGQTRALVALTGVPALWVTLSINVTGALIMGWISGWANRQLSGGMASSVQILPLVFYLARYQEAVTAGFLGGYTTFSSLCLETLVAFRQQPVTAILYFGSSSTLGLLATTIGWELGIR